MPDTSQGFARRLRQLQADLVEQGLRVSALVEEACDAVFSIDTERARSLVDRDDDIDRVDVAIERASVRLLEDATKDGARLDEADLRSILTIVKVNNELERTADAAVSIALLVPELGRSGERLPPAFRVLANSVVGILRDVNRAYERSDAALAKVALQSEDTVESFKAQLLREAERRVAQGAMSVDLAFLLHEIASQLERMADHATNVAEQIIYAATGVIVRHTDAGWVELPGELTGG